MPLFWPPKRLPIPKILWILTVLITGAYLFLRWYRIEASFLFLNDAGRDLLVLRQWFETWKPPLLGPQNSTLPFNQSAVYFYWLMPLYVLTGFSWLSPHLTLTLTTLTLWVLALWWVRHPRTDRRWWPWLLALGWLTTIHPQVILQNRFVWNPSFLLPLIAPAVIAGVHLIDPETRLWSRVFAASLALSFAFTYAAVPVGVALVLTITAVSLSRRHWAVWKLWRDTLIAGLITHAPTIAYELKYRGQLIRAVLASGGEQITQSAPSPRLHDLLQHTLMVPHSVNAPWIALALIVLCAAQVWLQSRDTRRTPQDRLFLFAFTVLMFSLAGTFLLSTPMHSHYVFGLLLLALTMVASLRPILRYPTLVFLSILWLVPTTLVTYFRPTVRDMATMQSCAQQVCSTHMEPLFVSGTSGLLPFHNVPDWRYAFKDAGCNLRNLELAPHEANTMAVVEEFTKYTHGQDAFHELSLFGASTPSGVLSCAPRIRVHFLQRQP